MATILEALLDYNAHRQKTTEQKSREFAAYKEVETEKAKARRLVTQNNDTGSAVVLNSAQLGASGKARDIAASKIGMKRDTAEKALKVVRAIDRAESNGNLTLCLKLPQIVLGAEGWMPAIPLHPVTSFASNQNLSQSLIRWLVRWR